jgi:hypothetical protein
MMGADSANDSLFLYLPGGKTCIYPQTVAGQMSGTDIMDSLNDATRTVTATWEWDGGNIIAADGQKVIWTADDEGDSASAYVSDTFHITADVPMRIGGAGITTVDSLLVNGKVTGNVQIRDTLIIPTYAAVPATGSEGLFAADSANDSLIAYWGAARRVIYPSTSISVVSWQFLGDDADSPWTVASGADDTNYGCFSGATSPADSVVIDSINAVYLTTENDVYIDTIALIRGSAVDQDYSSTVLWGDGTNVGAGDGNYHTQTYTPNVTYLPTTRYGIYMGVATSGTAGQGRAYNITLYGHYQ